MAEFFDMRFGCRAIYPSGGGDDSRVRDALTATLPVSRRWKRKPVTKFIATQRASIRYRAILSLLISRVRLASRCTIKPLASDCAIEVVQVQFMRFARTLRWSSTSDYRYTSLASRQARTPAKRSGCGAAW
jgi:hypothetical protein